MRMDVIFERSGANPFTMKIDLFDTVPEIKKKIHKHQGIPISDQTLIFEGTILSDDFNILYSNIIEQSTIHLVVASDHPAAKRVKTAAANELIPPAAATSRMTAENNNIINDFPAAADMELKQKIHEHRAKTARPQPPLRVLVVYDGKRIPVEVNKEDRISTLRNKLEKLKKLEKMKVELPKIGCFFIHKQNLMEDDESFRWHNVAQGDEIEMFAGRVSSGS